MAIINIGTDIVECARIGEMIERHGDHFKERIFTLAEIAYCQSHRKSAVERFAGRFAAKEAILKAIGTGWRNGISWLELEVRPASTGRPLVALGGVARAHALSVGIASIHLSISHCRAYATATAVADDQGELLELTAPPSE